MLFVLFQNCLSEGNYHDNDLDVDINHTIKVLLNYLTPGMMIHHLDQLQLALELHLSQFRMKQGIAVTLQL